MLEKIRSEVKRRGTQKSITLEIIEADMNDTTDYVIRRPRIAMTTRDYLNDKHRYVPIFVCNIIWKALGMDVSFSQIQRYITCKFP